MPRKYKVQKGTPSYERKASYESVYKKKHYKNLTLMLNVEADADIIGYMANKPSKGPFVKELIRKHMKSEGAE